MAKEKSCPVRVKKEISIVKIEILFKYKLKESIN